MGESNELFDLKNYFFIGNYQTAINEAMNINSKSLSEYNKLQRDLYMYRSYIAKGNYKFVLTEIDDSATIPLLVVKLLASYLATPENKEEALTKLKKWLSEGIIGNDSKILQVIGATIYYHEENYEEAMRCVYQSDSLEGLVE